ncbi:unnamed protein product [Discosporangium mesarthrocarpum]
MLGLNVPPYLSRVMTAKGFSVGNGGVVQAGVAGATLATKPSLVEWRKLRFVVMDAPKANNLHLYLRELKKHNVVRVIRVCEETYPASEVEAAGMQLLEMEYDDGDAPPQEIIDKWLDVVHSTFKDAPDTSNPSGEKGPSIAVHCVAGLGRAPVLVAIALIENGQDPIQAVEFIRRHRRGAINRKQLSYLESYERQSRNSCTSCSIM